MGKTSVKESEGESHRGLRQRLRLRAWGPACPPAFLPVGPLLHCDRQEMQKCFVCTPPPAP